MLAPWHEFENLNVENSVLQLQKYAPDVLLVFGTGKLQPDVIKIAPTACLNLHGGNPEFYRGLDSHLWAIYQEDFVNLMSTLHHVDEKIDSGNIVFQSPIPLTPRYPLYQLRSRNTQVCLEMTLRALKMLSTGEPLPAHKQQYRGKYYSFMPSTLKEECVQKFERLAPA